MAQFNTRVVGQGVAWAVCTVLVVVLGCKFVSLDLAAAEDTPSVPMHPLSEIIRQLPPATLPPLSFTTLDGVPRPLASFAGKPVVLNFWATWCGPCVAELPELDKLAATHPDIAVLAVSVDRGGAAAVKPFAAAHGISHAQVLLDQQSKDARHLQIGGFPTTLLIGADGKLYGRMEGPADWSTAAGVVGDVTK